MGSKNRSKEIHDYYLLHKEQILLRAKERYSRKRLEILAYLKERWRRPEVKRAHKIATKKHYEKMKTTIYLLLGNKCCKCGFTDRRTFQIDHIFGKGTWDRGTDTRGYYRRVLLSLRNGEHKYQLLCANCNQIKRFEKGENRNASSSCCL